MPARNPHEAAMPDPKDEPIGGTDADREFDRLCDTLFLRITEFVEEEDVGDEELSLMLLQLAITTRMMAYVVSVDKPSGFGLKLDLDRFRRDVDEVVREAKNGADDFIAQAKETLEQAAKDEEE
jgi:hypothetical protein